MTVASQPARKPKVLVVDDIRANQIALEAVLEDRYDVISVDSGEQAVALLSRPHSFDLILMDVQMPGMDGYETTERIKKLPGARDIPVIFVTAVHTEDPYVRRGYEAGGLDYFTKPFDPEILKRKVDIYTAYKLKTRALEERTRWMDSTEEVVRVGRKLSSILETLPVGVLIADTHGRICQTTEESMRIFGCARSTDHGALSELLGWWDASGRMIAEVGPLARALLFGETSHSEPVEIRCFDGSAKTILVSASPLYGLSSQRVGAVVIMQDVSHAARLTKDLEQRVTGFINLGVELEETGSEA